MRLFRPAFVQSLAVAGIATALSCTALPAFSAENHAHGTANAAVDVAQARQQAYDHTQALIALQKRWEKAQGSEKSQALEQLVAKAEERRVFLLELMQSNPAEVLRVAIPEDKQRGMPAEVVQTLEQQLEVEGDLHQTYYHYKDESVKLRSFLKTPFGETFEVHSSEALNAPGNSKSVAIRGVLIPNSDNEYGSDGAVALGTDEDAIVWAYLGGDGSSADSLNGLSGTASDLTPTKGEQRAAVFLVNFQDDPNNKPWTVASIQNTMTKVDQFYQEGSYQQTWFNTDVLGWYTIPYSGTNCDSEAWQDAALNAASRQNNLSQYTRYIFIFPNNSCTWSGAGSLTSLPSRAHLNGSPGAGSIAHELGHNLGLNHSSSINCGSSSIGGSCTTKEYGDIADQMGNAFAHFNAHQKERLGWLSGSDILTVSSDGTYKISPFEKSGSLPKALKIYKGDGGIGNMWGDPAYYYAEFRQPTGFDSLLSSYGGNLTDGALIHFGYESYSGKSYLLDMNPDAYGNLTDGALVPGDRFTDPASGLSITTINSDSSGLTLSVQNVQAGTVGCVPAQPSLALSPAQGPWVAAGTAVTYTLTLTNNDSNGCSSSSFGLSTSKPSGWATSFSATSLNLAPGQSASAKLTVTSSSSALDGFYSLSIAAANASHSATGTVTYVVDNPSTVNSAPVANNDSASTSENTAVTINVLANDTDADGDALSISSVSGVNSTAKINSNGSITFTPATGFTGIESFSYTVTDGKGGSDSATVSVNVTAATTSTNQAPVAVDDSASSDGNSAVTIAVLANDNDPDGDTLTITGVSQAAKGSVKINANGTVTFTPAKNFKNGDSFSYTISDGKSTASANVNIAMAGGGSSSTGKGNGRNK
ncbi:peptidase M11 [Marinobacterium zhoushanense]|uniref:Peptidase M11 n=1 Tax=Marinobacterium zhoushanense TaxID=1679163 RepID=A0ABQ1KQG9_9GAMM|nr:Ig-like domain-containing protein [Marinobacterium zhoushanense]GGC02118.1 peptidase M11 [Marinobacterium zhoushanense]